VHDTTSLLDAALAVAFEYGPIIPIHTPVATSELFPGGCSCHNSHRDSPHDVGKHPRLEHGLKESSASPERIRYWWDLWPEAGIGLDLVKAGLVDVAPDSEEWQREFFRRGLPPTRVFSSGGGDGHTHHLYRRPDEWPEVRDCHSGEYDVMSAGYAIMPPSLHHLGTARFWVYDDLPLADAPEWILHEHLTKRPKGRTAGTAERGSVSYGPELEALLAHIPLEVWNGELIGKNGQRLDRSRSLVAIAGELAKAGASLATIIALLQERDRTLGWNKYADRTDREVRYEELALDAIARAVDQTERVGESRQRVEREREQHPHVDRAAWPEPMAEEAFYGPLGEFVKRAAEYSEASREALLAMALSACSAAMHPQSAALAGDAYHAMRINAVLVGPTAGGRKGTAAKPAEAVLRIVDPVFETNVVEGLSSGEGLIYRVRDKVEKWNAKAQDYDVVDPGVFDKRLWVVETEFGGVLQMLQREGSALSAVVRRAWDLDPSAVLQTLTKNSPTKATGAHIAIAGHITREELIRNMTRTDLVNGFGNRFLWFASKMSRPLPFGDRVNPVLIADFARHVTDVSAWSSGKRSMDWAVETQPHWAEAYARLLESGSARSSLYIGITARAHAQVLRLALMYAAFDLVEAILPQHLTAALAVWGYVERTCQWVYGSVMGDKVADDILYGLRDRGPMTRTEIRDYLGHHVSKPDKDRAFADLLELGLIVAETGPGPNGGDRPTTTYRAV